MNTVKEHLHTAIEQLSEEEADIVLNLVEMVYRKETIKIPNALNRRFREVEPVTALGKPASQQLIDDRR